MIKLDAEALELQDLPEDVAGEILDHAVGLLETRVGQELATRLTDMQLEDFEGVMEAGDHEATMAWLAEHLPDYPTVVRAEFDRLVAQISEERPRIVAHLAKAKASRTAALTTTLAAALTSLRLTHEINEDRFLIADSGLTFTTRVLPDTPGYLRLVTWLPAPEIDESSTLRLANTMTRDIRVIKVTVDEDGDLQVSAETNIGEPHSIPTEEQLATTLRVALSLMHAAVREIRKPLAQASADAEVA